MQSSESYRQREKRKDNRIAFAVLSAIVAVALSVRWYSDAHKPPVHPLKVVIVERGIPQDPLHSVNEDYLAPGDLVVSDNMKELGQGRAIEAKAVKWELVDVQQRKSALSPWSPPHFNDNEVKPPPFPIDLRETGEKYPYWQINSFANHAGEWKITIRASRSYYDADTKEEWGGSGEYVLTRTLREDWKGASRAKEIAARRARGMPDPTSTPPPGTHPLDPRKDYVAGIQWSGDNGKTWITIPQKGQKGFPLTIPSETTSGFRAVKKRTQEPWPDWSGQFMSGIEEILVWGGQVHPGILTGEQVWIQPRESQTISQDADDLKTITVACGNTVTGLVRVLPELEVSLDIGPVQAIPNQPRFRRVSISATAQWGMGWNPPTRFHFVTQRTDYQILPPKAGQSKKSVKRTVQMIGEVNKPGKSDDTVATDGSNTAHAVLMVPADVGGINVRAVLLGPDGNAIAEENQQLRVPRF